MERTAGSRLGRALTAFLVLACVVAACLASLDAYVGFVAFDAALTLGLTCLLLGFASWVVRTLRAPGANPVELWATERGLAYAREGELPEATPLLGRGQSRRATDLVTGELAAGVHGVLARYTYVAGRGDERRPYRYSVVVTAVPESVAFAPLLLCRHRRTARVGDDGHEETYADRRSVALESAQLRRDYEIETWSGQDPVWTRELFSPTFVAWLDDGAPERLSFELVDGALCASLPGHDHEPEALEALVAATAHVARRLREESLEEEGRASAAVESPPGSETATAGPRAGVVRVAWPEPPADAVAASRRYRRVVAREPGVWLWALAIGAATAAGISGEELVESGPGVESLAPGAAIGLVVACVCALGLVRQRARVHGRDAFVREYARSRGLELRSGRRFHADHLRLPLPGTAEHALSGRLLAAGREAELVLAADRTNRRTPVHYAALVTRVPAVGGVPWLRLRPAGPAAAAARRIPAVAAEPGTRLERLEERLGRRYAVTAATGSDEDAAERLLSPEVASALLADGRAAYSLTLHGSDLAVFRAAPAPDARSAAELDRFCAEAGGIATEVGRAAARGGRARVE